MGTLTYTNIQDLVLDELQANVTTDAPIVITAGGELERAINDALAQVWEASGGTLTAATHATLWNETVAAGTQTLTGKLASIEEILHLWFSGTSGSTGYTAGDFELQVAELSLIHWLRSNGGSGVGVGLYSKPQYYAVTKAATVTPANVNKFTIEYWPPSTGVGFFPAHYIPQFSAIDAATVTTPDLNDIQSRDVAYLCAFNLAERFGRAEFKPGIMAKLSEATRLMLDRKLSSMVDAKQDR